MTNQEIQEKWAFSEYWGFDGIAKFRREWRKLNRASRLSNHFKKQRDNRRCIKWHNVATKYFQKILRGHPNK